MPILAPAPVIPPPPDPRAEPPWSRPIADLDQILTASQLAAVLARMRSQRLTVAKEWVG